MGLMLGKVDGETMIIMDSFALPVEGTETRVNAQAAAYEYMAAYIENAKQVILYEHHHLLFFFYFNKCFSYYNSSFEAITNLWLYYYDKYMYNQFI